MHGKLKGPKGEVGEITGSWSDKMDLTRKVGFVGAMIHRPRNACQLYRSQGQGKETFFDAHAEKVAQKIVAPEDKQGWNESRK